MTDFYPTALEIVWIAIACGIVMFLPGAAWLAWVPRRGRSVWVFLADALGLSIALTALAGLVTFLFGIPLNGAAVLSVYIALGLAAMVGWLRQPAGPRPGWRAVVWLVCGVVFALALVAWRLSQANGLAFPAWVDSIQHVFIVRLVLEKGGLLADFEPYLPAPFYYHYGFHALAAVFTFFSRLSPDRAVLVFGQVLNAAMGLVLYRLALAVFDKTDSSELLFRKDLLPELAKVLREERGTRLSLLVWGLLPWSPFFLRCQLIT